MTCPLGCGLLHSPDGPSPAHDPVWLEAERVRLADAKEACEIELITALAERDRLLDEMATLLREFDYKVTPPNERNER